MIDNLTILECEKQAIRLYICVDSIQQNISTVVRVDSVHKCEWNGICGVNHGKSFARREGKVEIRLRNMGRRKRMC